MATSFLGSQENSSRAASRTRDFSISPHPDSRVTPPESVLSSPPPNKPPRTSYHGGSGAGTDPRLDHQQPPPLPIEPYSITTISHGDGSVRIHNSRSSESPLPAGMMMNSIPPPAIIRNKLDSVNEAYYCTPAEMERVSSKGATRILNEDGVFVDRDPHTSHSSLESNSLPGFRPTLGEGESNPAVYPTFSSPCRVYMYII